MGLKLDSPIIVSACTLSEKTGNIVKMEDNGAGAVVMFSLFEEQFRKEWVKMKRVSKVSDFTVLQPDYLPENEDYEIGCDEYLECIRKAKERVKIPVIASLNGISLQSWIDHAVLIQQAGADALEINIFFIPGDIYMSSSEVEHRYLNIISAIKQSVKIPVAVKLNPYFSAMGNMALRMEHAGANALVLFNRFYQPDFDIDELILKTEMNYSDASEIRLPLLWISLLYSKVALSLAATTGVQTGTEVIKYLLAGADAVMTASSLYKNGISHLKTMSRDIQEWMYKMGFDTIDSFRGNMSRKNILDPERID